MKRRVSKLKKKHNFCNTDNSEATTRCSTKESALKISQYPQENTRTGVPAE